MATDIGSDVSNAINGLTEVNANDISTTSLDVDGIATISQLNVSGNEVISGNLTVYGSYFGPTISGSTGTYQYLSAGTGTINYLSSGTGSFNYLSATGAFINSLTVGTLIGGPNISGEAEGSAPTYNEIVRGMTGWTSLGTSPLQQATAMCWSDTRQEVLAVENNGISPNYINDVVVFATPTFTRSFVGQTTLFEPSGVLYQNRRSRYIVWGNPTAFSTSTLQYSTTGSSWTAISFNQTVRALAYDEVSDITLWINPGTFDCVFRSTNGGATYTQPPIGSFLGPIISMRGVGMNPYTGVYIVCGDNGRIGVSRDRGLTWTLSTVGTANWNEVVCNTRENTWVLVANSGTTNTTAYSSDSGSTWTLANSLAPYDDMVYVPQLNSFIAGANTREIFLSNTDGRTWNNMGLIGSGTWGVSHIIYIPTVSRLLVGGFDSGSPFENRLYVSEMILPTSFNSTMINPGQIITSNGNLVSITAPTISATTSLQFSGATGGTLFVDTINSNTGIYNYFSAGTGSINSFSYGSATGATLYGQTVSGPTGSFTNLGSTNLSFTSATGSTITAGTGAFQSISVQNLTGGTGSFQSLSVQNFTGGTGYFQSLSTPNFNVPTATITNLNFTNATGANLTATTATIPTLNSTSLTVTNPQYQPIQGNLLTSFTHRAQSTVSFEGYCESANYVCGYGYIGCNGVFDPIQLFDLNGSLTSAHINLPTTAITQMPFAILYSRATGAILKTWRLPYGTSGGSTCLGACFDSLQNLYLCGYINNTSYGASYNIEGWDENIDTPPKVMTTSTTQFSWCIGLDTSVNLGGVIQAFFNKPNGAGSYFNRVVAGDSAGEVFIAGAYLQTGTPLTVSGATTIPTTTTLAPYIVWMTLVPAGATFNNVWYGPLNATHSFSIRDLIWLSANGGELFMYLSYGNASSINLYNFGAVQTTLSAILPQTWSTGASWACIFKFWKTAPNTLVFIGRAWVTSGNTPLNGGSAGRMVYNPINGNFYLTGTTTSFSDTTTSGVRNSIDNISLSIGEPLKNIRTATNIAQMGFLASFTRFECNGVGAICSETALFDNRGESATRLGACYVDADGNLYVYGRIQLATNDQDTVIDCSPSLTSSTPFVFRNTGNTNSLHNFFIKFDKNDRLIGYAPGITTDINGSFTPNGFCSWRSGSRLTIACSNPLNSAEYTLFGYNFNNTYSGIWYQTGTSPTRAEGLVFAIKADSTTAIGSKGVSIGWDWPLTTSQNQTYQDFESAQLRVAGQITSATAVTTPSISSYNFQNPQNDNYRPTLALQPEGGVVVIGSDTQSNGNPGARLNIGQGVATSRIANRVMPYKPHGVGFGDCHWFWDGCVSGPITTSDEVYNRLVLGPGVSQATFYFTTRHQQAYMFDFNITRDDTSYVSTYNPTAPITQYISWSLPAYAGCDNCVFIQSLARDRWSNLQFWLMNLQTNMPAVFLGERSTSGVDGGSGLSRNSSLLGPWNTHARSVFSSYHEWISVNIPKQYLSNSAYCRSGEFRVVIKTVGGHTDAGKLYISGVAVAPNPYSIQQRACFMDWWRRMSLNQTVFTPSSTDGAWNEEGMMYYNTAGRYVQFFFCLPEYPCTTDWILSLLTHNNTWESPQLQLLVPSSTVPESQRARRGAGPSFVSITGAGLYREGWHIYIKKDVMNLLYSNTTNQGFLYNFQFQYNNLSTIDIGFYPRGYAIERATPSLDTI